MRGCKGPRENKRKTRIWIWRSTRLLVFNAFQTCMDFFLIAEHYFGDAVRETDRKNGEKEDQYQVITEKNIRSKQGSQLFSNEIDITIKGWLGCSEQNAGMQHPRTKSRPGTTSNLAAIYWETRSSTCSVPMLSDFLKKPALGWREFWKREKKRSIHSMQSTAHLHPLIVQKKKVKQMEQQRQQKKKLESREAASRKLNDNSNKQHGVIESNQEVDSTMHSIVQLQCIQGV